MNNSDKILVIEDENVTRNNLVNFLNSKGFDAIGAENGRVGINLAKEHLPKLIICDIMMPELDGYDVLTQLQLESETALIPFIFLTATSDRDSLNYGLEMGADDYLHKPITSQRLLNAIAKRIESEELENSQSDPEVVDSFTSQTVKPESALSSRNDELLKCKNLLLDRLLKGLPEHISKIDREIEFLRNDNSERNVHLEELQKEFARLLALVNQVSELEKIITPENAKMLNQFNFLNSKNH